MLDLSIYVNPGYFPTWGQEQNQITITGHATLRQLEILVITGRRKLNRIKVRERGWPPRYFLTRSTNTRRDPDAQAGCKPQNSSRNSPFSGAKLASVKRRTILLTSCALKPLKYLPVITFIKELNFETLRWHHSEKTAFSKFTSV